MGILTLVLLLVATVATGETIPQKPTKYFEDNAGLVSDATAHRFNETLAQFERDTSNQFVVVTYQYMDTDSDAADYTQRIAQSWGVGQKGKNNGLVLFVFMKTADGHGKIYAQVGYGLEGAIPDATAYQIAHKMTPYFKARQYETGLDTGIKDFMTAAKGEYTGTGKTVAETLHFPHGWVIWAVAILILLIVAAIVIYYGCIHEDEPEETHSYCSRRSFINSVSPAPPSRSYGGPYVPPPAYVDAPYVAPSYVSPSDDDSTSYHSSDDDSSSSSSSSFGSDSSFSSGGGSFGGGGAGDSF